MKRNSFSISFPSITTNSEKEKTEERPFQSAIQQLLNPKDQPKQQRDSDKTYETFIENQFKIGIKIPKKESIVPPTNRDFNRNVQITNQPYPLQPNKFQVSSISTPTSLVSLNTNENNFQNVNSLPVLSNVKKPIINGSMSSQKLLIQNQMKINSNEQQKDIIVQSNQTSQLASMTIPLNGPISSNQQLSQMDQVNQLNKNNLNNTLNQMKLSLNSQTNTLPSFKSPDQKKYELFTKQTRSEELRKEFEANRKQLKSFETLQQSVLLFLLNLFNYEIEIDKNIQRKKKNFPMFEILSLKKHQGNSIVNCGIQEYVAKLMKETKPQTTDAARSEYKQKKRNNIIIEYLTKVISEERCQLETYKFKLMNKMENVFVIQITVGFSEKTFEISYKDIVKVGKHVNHLILSMATLPEYTKNETIHIQPMDQMMVDIFIQYFNGTLNHFEDPHRWKDFDYPPQNIVEIVQKRKQKMEIETEKNFDFVNEDLVDWMKRLF